MRDLSKLSGEEHFARAPQFPLNLLRLNGKKGVFEYRDVKKGTIPHPKDPNKKVYETKELGREVTVTFLRIRRKIVEKQGEKPLPGAPRPAYSQEHSSKYDTLLLTTDFGVQVGSNDELREQFKNLRTQQIVYCLYNGEIVRLTCKGASLGSNSKDASVSDFYSYIGSFTRNPLARDKEKDHFYEFETSLLAVEETSDLGEYYTIDFKRGKALDEKQMEAVGKAMEEIDAFVRESDDFYAARIARIQKTPPETPAPVPKIEYPEGPEEEPAF